MGRVADFFDPVVQFELRVPFRGQRVNDDEPAPRLRHPVHFSQDQLRLEHVVERALAGDEVERGAAVWELFGITPFELRVLDIPLELKLPRLEKHFKSQIDSPREADSRRQGQRQLPGAAGHIQCEISREGPGEFHLLGQNLLRVSHGIL